jgi:allantoate deiminase
MAATLDLTQCRQAAAEILQRCEQLATLTAVRGKIDRRYLTAEHKACNAEVKQWMQQGGLRPWQDEAGNICGSLPGRDASAGTLLVGSHLDSVPDAGKYDGILGVLLPITALRLLSEHGEQFPFAIDVIGFADEEGSRFGTTLLGSRAAAGSWRQDWFALQDTAGISLKDALVEFGCDATAISRASRAADKLVGYLEIHIEQGPVLEAADLPVGVVTSIAGARRYVIDIVGQAGHAGTVPMPLRKDALVAAAKLVLLIEQVACKHDVVATVGKLECAPGAPNVIPGNVRMTLDIRSGLDPQRDAALQEIRDAAELLIAANGCTAAWKETHNAGAVGCALWMQDVCADAIKAVGYEPLALLSGAGHDAMAFKGVCDIGMLFVRCLGGISHHPDESITLEDTAIALQTFCETLLQLRKRITSV